MNHTQNTIVITKKIITKGSVRFAVSPNQQISEPIRNSIGKTQRIPREEINLEELIKFKKESMEHARKEKPIRINLMQKQVSKDTRHRLMLNTIKVLEGCRSSKRCHSPACPICGALEKQERLEQHLKMYQDFNHPKFITVIFYHATFSELSDVYKVLKDTKKQLVKILKVSGIEKASGSFEVDYHESYKIFIPHFHLIADAGADQIKPLRQQLSDLCSGITYQVIKRALVVKKIKDPVKVLSYLSKYAWFRIYRFKDQNGKERTEKVRMQSPMFELSIITLDRLSFEDINFDTHYNNAKDIDSKPLRKSVKTNPNQCSTQN